MNVAAPHILQAQIDDIDWYHEFDFGNGLHAVSKTPDIEAHREVWRFIKEQLDLIDFRDKTVLEVGCWDGYWSFYAEGRGAKSVLATDDATQNWASGRGLLFAKQLLKSSIAVDQTVSMYELSKLSQTFDIVLCLGVYYHLIDPFAAFAQMRHCCHRSSIIALEGDATLGLRPDTSLWDPKDASKPIFIPTPYALAQMLRAAYFDVLTQTWRQQPRSPSLCRRLEMYSSILGLADPAALMPPRNTERMLTVCKAFEGENALHPYKPPFGLDRYDRRFG